MSSSGCEPDVALKYDPPASFSAALALLLIRPRMRCDLRGFLAAFSPAGSIPPSALVAPASFCAALAAAIGCVGMRCATW